MVSGSGDRGTVNELRPYQSRAVAGVLEQWTAGERRVLLVAPTGSGKSRMAEEFVRLELAGGGSVLILVHRLELLAQMADRMLGAFGVGARVDVVTVQTLAARGTRPEASLLIGDEIHHFASDQWSTVLNHYTGARVLGLTATPERQDGRPLGDLFSSLVVAANYSELIADGHLVPCRVFSPPEVVEQGLAQPPVEAYLKLARGERAFFFCSRVAEAHDLAAELNAAGVPAGCIEGTTDKAARARMLRQFADGELLALTNIYCLTEGVDVPSARVCVLARGCAHVSNYLQMVGRVLRPSPGKTDAILIDLPGVSVMHGLPTEDRRYSLDGNGIRRTTAEPIRVCPQCGATYVPTAGQPCPACGYMAPVKEFAARIYNLELKEVYAGAATPQDAKSAELARLRALASDRGWGLSWVAKEYRKLFSESPDLSRLSEAERRAEFRNLAEFAAARGFKPGFAAVRFRETFGAYPPRGW